MGQQLTVRTATDTVMILQANFDLSPKRAEQIKWKTAAKELQIFLRLKSSVQFYEALKECFADKEKVEK